jgi:hypothetical protein
MADILTLKALVVVFGCLRRVWPKSISIFFVLYAEID